MNDTPDIGRIVSLIMSNPKLIEEISALAKSDSESLPEANEPVTAEVSEPVSAPPTYAPTSASPTKRNRSVLLDALRPYVSSERQQAIDRMMSLADVFDAVRRKS